MTTVENKPPLATNEIKALLERATRRRHSLVLRVTAVCGCPIEPSFPLLSPETIKKFSEKIKSGEYSELTSQFDGKDSGALHGYNKKAASKKGSFEIPRLEALEADNLDGLKIVESVLLHNRQKYKLGEFKMPAKFKSIEHELKGLINRDGVAVFKDQELNVSKINIEDIKKRMGKAPWLHFLFYTATDQTALICQAPGEGARNHCHVTHDEWWVVLQGQFEWRLENGEKLVGNQGDVMFLPRGVVHNIVCTSETDGIRLACGARDMEHVYV
jgi:quercetin dioxygenase-like cupin family protein